VNDCPATAGDGSATPAAIATGYVTTADFDRIVNPAAMVGQPSANH
jgi:hypothetical protein